MSINATMIAAVLAVLLSVSQSWAHPPEAGQGTGNGAQADAPGNHGMFLVGSETLFLLHMPMFTAEKHMYQVVLRARMPDKVMEKYRSLRKENPDKPYNLINIDNDKFTLPQLKSGEVRRFSATLFDGYSNSDGGAPGPVLMDDVAVVIDEVVVFRHFNFGIDRPENLVYALFGRGNEAHMTHYISRDPDFQHILTLPEPPASFSEAQLAAGVELDFTSLASQPAKCSPPLGKEVYNTLFQGREDAPVSLDLRSGMHSVWYSTGNLLNSEDPCKS